MKKTGLEGELLQLDPSLLVHLKMQAMASPFFEQYFTLTMKSVQHQLVNLATDITQNP